MRIIAGRYGGRRLHAPKDDHIRPTGDKVRGAIFNALQARSAISDAFVLDVFCGAGSLGLEALSRGAAHCTFIDHDQKSLALARQNAELLNITNAHFRQLDAARLPQNPTPQNVASRALLDPPYDKGLIEPGLESLARGGWLQDKALIVVESEKTARIELPAGFEPDGEKIYGDTKITYLIYTSTPE